MYPHPNDVYLDLYTDDLPLDLLDETSVLASTSVVSIDDPDLALDVRAFMTHDVGHSTDDHTDTHFDHQRWNDIAMLVNAATKEAARGLVKYSAAKHNHHRV